MADPRIIRTRSRLRDAVLALAAETAVEDITVEEVCAAAGVSRATFYRHASNPAEILQNAIRSELTVQRRDFVRHGTGRGPELRDTHRRLIARLATHLDDFGDAYALSLPRGQSAMGAVLAEHLYQAALEYVQARRADIALLRDAAPGDAAFVEEALARQYAGGELGLVQAWIASTPRHRDVLESLMLELAPDWNRRLMEL